MIPPTPDKKAATPHKNNPVPIRTEPRKVVEIPTTTSPGALTATYLEILYNLLNTIFERFDE